jgi:hypothetical protein
MLTVRLADGPLLGECLDHVVLCRSSARSSGRSSVLALGRCFVLFVHGLIVLGMVSRLVLGFLLPCSLQLSHCRFLCHRTDFLRQVTLSPVSRLWLVDLCAGCAVKVLGRLIVNFGRSFGLISTLVSSSSSSDLQLPLGGAGLGFQCAPALLHALRALCFPVAHLCCLGP